MTENRMKTGGRVKGTLNKANQAVQERLNDLNCDPIEGMVTIAKEAYESGDYSLVGYCSISLATRAVQPV